NKDLIKWLCSIPNPYLHFGDFDFAGIGIYLYEYKKYLANKATFFIPENLENMLANFGNYSRYNKQRIYFDLNLVDEKNLIWLVDMIHKYKKGLDQEAFIRI
ncbi:MAG: hypothetical protein LBD45_07960, partial [Bacteroidales bacterium]|nr:hypothetical protein [Bacteroidales bacterium]